MYEPVCQGQPTEFLTVMKLFGAYSLWSGVFPKLFLMRIDFLNLMCPINHIVELNEDLRCAERLLC